MFSALERVFDRPGYPAAAAHAVPPVRTSHFRLPPHHLLLIVWSVDVAALTAAFVLSHTILVGLGPWQGMDLLVGQLTLAAWLWQARADASREGGGVSIRMRLRCLAPDWLLAFGAVSLGLQVLASFCRIAHLPLPRGVGFDPAWSACLFASGLTFLTAARRAIIFAGSRLAPADLCADGSVPRTLLIIGEPTQRDRAVAALRTAISTPIRPAGVVEAHDAARATLADTIRRHRVEIVAITLPPSGRHDLPTIVARLASAPVDIWLVPGEESAPSTLTSSVAQNAVFVRRRPLSPFQQAVKLLEDRVAGALLLAFVLPVMLLIAAAIRLESAGPVLFAQQRRGYGERLITVLKFRTMYAAARDDHATQQTVRNDARVTRVGRVLRRLSLDELPQLINVLRGEMSLVGPRPHALHTKADGLLFDEAVENYSARHRVKPGITGWAQVNGWRGETDTVEKIAKRVEFDLDYIEAWSLRRDLLILFRTVRRMPADREAY